MKEIPICGGHVALVDDCDYDMVIKFKWRKTRGYALTRKPGEKTTTSMHRMILKTPKGLETDHINGNKLDNRRENLRICTTSENQRNRPIRRDSGSMFKGLSFDKRRMVFRAYICLNRKNMYLGTFSNSQMAYEARKQAEKIYHGEFTNRNTSQPTTP